MELEIEEEEQQDYANSQLILRNNRNTNLYQQTSEQMQINFSNSFCFQQAILDEPKLCHDLFVRSIEKPLYYEKQFFLANDTYIEYTELDDDQSFTQFREMQKRYRPIESVSIDKKSGFVKVAFDHTQKGLSNFQFIIKQMKSLGSSQYFQLAEFLEQFQNLIDLLKSSANLSFRAQHYERNSQIFNEFRYQQLPKILQQLNQRNFYYYFLTDFVLTEAVSVEYGVSERLIKLLGSNTEEYKNLLLRQGWFDPTMYCGRNKSTQEYISVVFKLLQSKFMDTSMIEVPEQITLLTLNDIKINAQIQTKIYFCYSEHVDPIFPQMKGIIGYLTVMNLTINEESAKQLINLRNNDSPKRRELSYQHPQESFQHFQYQCSSEAFSQFIQKYSPSQHNKVDIQKQKADQSRTCNFKYL